MPHHDYWQRLISETQHSPTSSDGMRHLTDRQRGQSEGQMRSPRLSTTSDNDHCKAGNRHHGSDNLGDKLNVKAGLVAARALAAVEDADNGEPSRDRGNHLSQLAPPISLAPSTPQPHTRVSSPPRQGQRCHDNTWGAVLKQKIHNFAIFNSPANSVASSQNNAGRSLAKKGAASSQSAARLPSDVAIRSQNAAGHIVLGSRNGGSEVTNGVAAMVAKVAVSQNGDGLPTKLEMSSPYLDRSFAMADSDQRTARENPSENFLIDLTEDDSGEDARIKNNQTVRDHVEDQTSNKPQINEKEKNTPTMSEEENSQTLNNYVADHTSNQRDNQEKPNNTLKPCDTTGNNSNNGQEQPVSMPHKENNDQIVNHHVIDHTPNKQQNNDSESSALKPKNKTHPENSEFKRSPNKTRSPNKRRSPNKKKANNASPRKSSSPRKGFTKKSSTRALSSCLLTGKLSHSDKYGNRCNTIRGLWEYDNQAESVPQRFELRCDVSSDVELPFTTNGIFHGHFVYQWTPKGRPKTSFVIKETDVNLSFAEQDGELQVNGTGQNKFGRFDLVGSGERVSSQHGQDSYNVQLRKKYTELFPSQVPQPGHDESEKKSEKYSRKRKLLMVGSLGSEAPIDRWEQERQSSRGGVLSGSEASGDRWEGEKQAPREGMLPRAISMSAAGSNTSREPDDAHMVEELARNNKEGEELALVCARPRDKIFFDLIHAEPVSTTTEGGEKYDFLSMHVLPPENFQSSGAFSENDGNTSYGSWQECGALQGMNHSINVRSLSWNVRNVKPKYSQMNLDFFNSSGIVNAQDLLEADTTYLCSQLMAFDKFKAACAFATWKSKLNDQDSDNARQRKTFRDIYRPEFAKNSILSWKRVAESWYENIAGTDYVDSEMEEISVEKQAPLENIPHSRDKNGIQAVEGSIEIEEESSDDSVLLESILSSQEVFALKKNCNIKTAQQLLASDGKEVMRCLTGIFGVSFCGRNENEVECIIEGMLYSWMHRAQEAVQVDKSKTEALPSAPPATESHSAFQTRLSYGDLQFIRSQNISSDEQLANSDHSLLAHRYIAYLGKMRKQISPTAAAETSKKWRQGARLVLGLISGGAICDSLSQHSRLGGDPGHQECMNTVPNLCRTVADEENEGLPRRTIFTYERTNNVLYEFVASVKNSLCTPDAGKGAFLTFKGAKVLRASSMWKKKGPRQIPFMSHTRKPLEAIFSTSGATVTLNGSDIHADGRHYGPENDDSVGLYREFTLDDFVDTEDNITFSSKHLGCALIELESRYAPLLPTDRKTDQLFSVKDFIFSHEPSSWRFDVTEELNGHPQVVDFTDDTTGAPHDVAKSHMSMYVNEVGHNMRLVENVSACWPSPRAVAYYIHIDKPMAKDETVELLVNYKGHYEAMRERRGYGKANLVEGVKSDAHDITRVQRNLKDRFLVEASILKFTEDEIVQVIDFFKTRVWNGVKAATLTLASSHKGDDSNLLRQCIARRRMHWLAKILQTRFHELLGRGGASSLPLLDGSDNEECMYRRGMFVFVHGWPSKGPGSAYTGIATITSISRDKWNRNMFKVSLSDGKYIESVPEAVVTIPTHDDFKDAPKRTYSSWMKQKKQEDLPRMRLKTLKGFDTIKWDPSFVWNISTGLASGSSSEMQANILQSLRWEISEELLFLLAKNKRLSHPFDGEIWCPLSVSLSTKCLHLIADFLLMGRDKKILCRAFMGLVRDAANTMESIIYKSVNASTNQELFHVGNLALVEKSNKEEDVHVLIVEAVNVNKLTVEDYLNNPQPLDLDWYLIHQVILAVHPLASLVDWGPSSGTGHPLFSIDNLCEEVGLDDTSYLNFYTSKVQEWRPLL